MSDYRDLLERAAERVTPSDGAFEALTRHRDRRRRGRRLSSAALALVVAAAGIGVAVAALGGHGPAPNPNPVASGPESFHALWPEQTLSGAQREQDAVEHGADQWRLDPNQVAIRFGQEVLGWTDNSDTVPDGPNGCRVDPQHCSNDGPDSATRPIYELGGPGGQIVVHLQRLVRHGAGGIWSVTSADGRKMSFPVVQGAEIPSGTTLELPTTLADRTGVQGAYSYIGRCGVLTRFVRPEVRGGLIRVRVGESSFEEHCESGGSSGSSEGGRSSAEEDGPGLLARPVDGYIFLEVAPGAEEGYDPLTPGGPQGTVPLEDFAAVAVRFAPATPSESPAPTSPSGSGLATYEDPAGWTISHP